ncbi:DUF4236 domain-containing protein [Streptomyces sp. NPDC004647]|uniref:DUF4236 domain-containing protein n=1 Tax=Streptomyces sp. NPDC004647 TaxID=3154671 RepID=UPI0033B12E7A
MPIHYHKRITIIPKLVHLNIGAHGWSVSFGPRQANITWHRHGRHTTTVRLPGGFSWRRRSGRH